MNANIQALVTVCQRLGMTYRILHADGNLVAVETPTCDRIFANWSTPFNRQSVDRLCRDKDYTYQALSSLMPMPKTQAFLNPQVEERYQIYVRWPTPEAIIREIERQFTYPLIIKRNRGTHGDQVFRVDGPSTVAAALTQIFAPQSGSSDYVALAQTYIDIAAEYRAIFLHGQLIFAYLKDTSAAACQGNLSPFRWDGTVARLESDPVRLTQFRDLIAPGLQQFDIAYTGVDIAIDTAGCPWVIELNSSPGFQFLVRDTGSAMVEVLYEKMLVALMSA